MTLPNYLLSLNISNTYSIFGNQGLFRSGYEFSNVVFPNRSPASDETPFYNGPIFDIHSHLWIPSSTSSTAIDERIESLKSFMIKYSVVKMAISGWYDEYSLESIDEITKEAADEYPGFLAFTHEFDLLSEVSIDYVNTMLDYGFSGVGELIIHGHHSSVIGDSDILMSIYRIAGQHCVPVLIHWDIGSIDLTISYKFSEYRITFHIDDVDAQRQQYIEELENVIHSNENTKFVLAHCGMGPEDGSGFDQDTFIDSLNSFLHRFDNLYLDISGMGKILWDDVRNEPSAIGVALLQIIECYHNRFLLGFDLDPKNEDLDPVNADEWIGRYLKYLGCLSEEVQENVAYRNAEELFSKVFATFGCRVQELDVFRPEDFIVPGAYETYDERYLEETTTITEKVPFL